MLQVSGFGPAEHLRSLGVDVVVHLPGVGSNLQDHAMVQPDYKCESMVSGSSASMH
jgi:choline dehydrogenase